MSAFWTPSWSPPAPPQPDPNLLLAQAEMQKAQTALAKAQAEFAVEKVKAQQQMADLQAQLASKGAELALKREEMLLTDARERDKAEADIAVQIAIANAQFGSQITAAQIDADIAREKLAMEHDHHATDSVIALSKQAAAAPKAGNGDTKPAPIKKKGPKVTSIQRDAEGRSHQCEAARAPGNAPRREQPCGARQRRQHGPQRRHVLLPERARQRGAPLQELKQPLHEERA